ncbi:Hypothetical predicted protein, partial [Pelobates cultripes]
MSQPKIRRHNVKTDKLHFFAQKKVATLALQTAEIGLQDGAGHSEESSPRLEVEQPSEREPLTTVFLQQALDLQSQKLISIWQTSEAELKRDLYELGTHTA